MKTLYYGSRLLMKNSSIGLYFFKTSFLNLILNIILLLLCFNFIIVVFWYIYLYSIVCTVSVFFASYILLYVWHRAGGRCDLNWYILVCTKKWPIELGNISAWCTYCIAVLRCWFKQIERLRSSWKASGQLQYSVWRKWPWNSWKTFQSPGVAGIWWFPLVRFWFRQPPVLAWWFVSVCIQHRATFAISSAPELQVSVCSHELTSLCIRRVRGYECVIPLVL